MHDKVVSAQAARLRSRVDPIEMNLFARVCAARGPMADRKPGRPQQLRPLRAFGCKKGLTGPWCLR